MWGPASDLISAQPTNHNWSLSSVFWLVFTSGSFCLLDLPKSSDTDLGAWNVVWLIVWLFPRGRTFDFPVLGFFCFWKFLCENGEFVWKGPRLSGENSWENFSASAHQSLLSLSYQNQLTKSLSFLCTIASLLWWMFEILRLIVLSHTYGWL